jgi:ribosomal protein L16 Arg81 hydroxylase
MNVKRVLATSPLDRLFAPLGPGPFLRSGWPSRVLVAHGPLARVGPLAELCRYRDPATWQTLPGVRYKASLSRGRRAIHVPATAEAAGALLAAGATISLMSVHREHAATRAWLMAIARQAGIRPQDTHANLYLSGKGRGTAAHYDDHHVVVLQLVGSKRWRAAPSGDLHPLRNFPCLPAPPEVSLYRAPAASARLARSAAVMTLRPGSALFLPAGTVHDTLAGEDSLSVSIGLGCARWFELVAEAVRLRLAADPRWRAPAWGLWGNGDQRARVAERLTGLLQKFHQQLGPLDADSVLAEHGHEAPALARLRRRSARQEE